MFESVVTDEGVSVLDEYTESSFKAYFNGNTKINKIAKALSPYADPVEFVNYLEPFADPVTKALLDAFLPYIPNATERTINEDIADLFVVIIKEAAATKRKSPSKKGTLENDSSNEVLKNKILASGQAMADALKVAIDNIANEDANNSQVLNPQNLSIDDKRLLDEFRRNIKDILIYCIDNDPSAGATKITLLDEIIVVGNDWQCKLREIEDAAFRNLVIDAIRVLNEYTYYLSDKFLRYIPGNNCLWFRNESLEEGDRLREELQPGSYQKRQEIAEIYRRLYPIPEDSTEKECVADAEVVKEESNNTETESKTTIIQHQTNVIQNGDNNFNLTNNGVMNFNFGGGNK